MSTNNLKLKTNNIRSFIISPVGAFILIIVLILIVSAYDILVSRTCRGQAERSTKDEVVSATDKEKRELPNIKEVDTRFREQRQCENEHKFLGIL